MGTNREMCLNFIMYYPKIDVETCLSSEIVAQPAFTAKYARPVFTDWYEYKSLLSRNSIYCALLSNYLDNVLLQKL